MNNHSFTVHDPLLTKYLLPVFYFLFAFFLPTQLGKFFWPDFTYIHGVRIDYLAPFISAFDVVCFSIIIMNVYKHSKLFTSVKNWQTAMSSIQTPIPMPILILLIVNTPFSLSPFVTIFKLFKVILFLAASYYVMNNVSASKKIESTAQDNRDAGYFVYGLITSTVFVFILALWQFITKSSIGGFWYFLGERTITLSLPGIAKASFDGIEYLRPYSTFSHPNSMGGFYLALYFLSEWFNKNIKVKKLRILLYLLQFISLLILILSFSKIAIAVFVALSIASLLSDQAYKGCVICFAARISVFLLLLFIAFVFSGDPYTIDKRLFLMNQSAEIIRNNFIFGTGFGTSIIAQSKLIGVAPGRFTDTLQPVHNIYLLILSEIGFLGLIFSGYFVFMKRKFFSNWKKMPVMAIFAILITGLFDHYWLTLPQNIALLCLVMALSTIRFDDL